MLLITVFFNLTDAYFLHLHMNSLLGRSLDNYLNSDAPFFITATLIQSYLKSYFSSVPCCWLLFLSQYDRDIFFFTYRARHVKKKSHCRFREAKWNSTNERISECIDTLHLIHCAKYMIGLPPEYPSPHRNTPGTMRLLLHCYNPSWHNGKNSSFASDEHIQLHKIIEYSTTSLCETVLYSYFLCHAGATQDFIVLSEVSILQDIVLSRYM